MRKWRLLLQVVGAVSLALGLLGCSFEVTSALDEVRYPRIHPSVPFFMPAFWSMAAVDTVLLATFIIASVMLLALRRRAAVAYTWVIAVLIIYHLTPGLLWLRPHGVGVSVAAATGVANEGTAAILAFPVPFLYALVSIVCVQIARKRLRSVGTDSSSAAR